MKVALNPAELWLIVDALDDKRQFQLQSGRAGGAGKRGLRTLIHLQRPKRFGGFCISPQKGSIQDFESTRE